MTIAVTFLSCVTSAQLGQSKLCQLNNLDGLEAMLDDKYWRVQNGLELAISLEKLFLSYDCISCVCISCRPPHPPGVDRTCDPLTPGCGSHL